MAPRDCDKLARMEQAVRILITGLGEDVEREGLRETPKRVAKALLDCTQGYHQDTASTLGRALFHEPIVHNGGEGVVVVRDIDFASTSEETLLPFHGRCHVAYRPKHGVVLGLSKLARLTKQYAKRLQSQERLAAEIAAALQASLECAGVAVVLQARHLTLSGVGPPGERVNAVVSGVFAAPDSAELEELLTLLHLEALPTSAIRTLRCDCDCGGCQGPIQGGPFGRRACPGPCPSSSDPGVPAPGTPDPSSSSSSSSEKDTDGDSEDLSPLEHVGPGRGTGAAEATALPPAAAAAAGAVVVGGGGGIDGGPECCPSADGCQALSAAAAGTGAGAGPGPGAAPQPCRCARCVWMEAAVERLLAELGEQSGRAGLAGAAARYVASLLASTSGYSHRQRQQQQLWGQQWVREGRQQERQQEGSLGGLHEEEEEGGSCCGRQQGGAVHLLSTRQERVGRALELGCGCAGTAAPQLQAGCGSGTCAREAVGAGASGALGLGSSVSCTGCLVATAAAAAVVQAGNGVAAASTSSDTDTGRQPCSAGAGGLEACGPLRGSYSLRLPFTSQCEHHMLPFYGSIMVSYFPPRSGGGGAAVAPPPPPPLPSDALERVVRTFTSRLQVQERITHQVADAVAAMLAEGAQGAAQGGTPHQPPPAGAASCPGAGPVPGACGGGEAHVRSPDQLTSAAAGVVVHPAPACCRGEPPAHSGSRPMERGGAGAGAGACVAEGGAAGCEWGVMVVCDAAHMCMVARGVENHAGSTTTFAVRGVFAARPDVRRAVLARFRECR